MNVQDILDVLSSSDIILEITVIVLIQEPRRQALRAIAQLTGGYTLYINEALGKDFRRYSYYFQKGEQMVKKWDNAPHWPNLKTFSHHFHIDSEKSALECREVFIEDVLKEMKTNIRLKEY